jgi:hypothetical protein
VTNSIGPFDIGAYTFIALDGNVILPREHAEITQRPGIAGTGLWLQGTFGDQFTLRSRVDEESMEAASDLMRGYSLSVGTIVQLVKDDLDYYDAYVVKFLVVAVRQVTMHAIETSSGGLNAPSAAWLEADWDLVAVEK